MIVYEHRFVLNYKLIKQSSKRFQYFLRPINKNLLFLSRRFQSRHFVIARTFPSDTLCYINRSTFMKVYEGMFFNYNMFGMIWLLLKRLNFFEGFYARSVKTWDTSMRGLIIQRQKNAYGEEFMSHLRAFTRLVQSRIFSSDSRIGQDRTFPGGNYSILKCVGHQLSVQYWNASTTLIAEKRLFVTSTCATKVKLQNQFCGEKSSADEA